MTFIAIVSGDSESERGVGAVEFSGEIAQRHGLDILPKRESLRARIHHEPAYRIQVRAGRMKTPLGTRREAAFDLDGLHPTAWQMKQRVDLRATARAVVIRLEAFGRGRDHVLDDEPLPARSGYRVCEQRLQIGDTQQGVS